MPAEFFWDIEQRTPEWFQLRAGLLCASDFQAIMANGEGRRKAIYRAACERVTGDPAESYSNDYMKRGQEQEAVALAKLALVKGVDPKRIGFVRDAQRRIGCSPDAIQGKKNRPIEIKTQKAELLAETLFKNTFPTAHIAQTQGHLMLLEADKGDLGIYCPKMPLFHKEFGRDERYIARLESELARATAEIDLIERRIRGYGII